MSAATAPRRRPQAATRYERRLEAGVRPDGRIVHRNQHHAATDEHSRLVSSWEEAVVCGACRVAETDLDLLYGTYYAADFAARARTARRAGWDVHGHDVSASTAAIVERRHGIPVTPGALESVPSAQPFRVVGAYHVFEHVYA
jgi:hypothetical protein